MKLPAIILAALLLAGCDANTSDDTGSFKLPHELRDCRVIEMERSGVSTIRLYVIKCPEGYLQTGTSYYNSGSKSTRHTTTVVM